MGKNAFSFWTKWVFCCCCVTELATETVLLQGCLAVPYIQFTSEKSQLQCQSALCSDYFFKLNPELCSAFVLLPIKHASQAESHNSSSWLVAFPHRLMTCHVTSWQLSQTMMTVRIVTLLSVYLLIDAKADTNFNVVTEIIKILYLCTNYFPIHLNIYIYLLSLDVLPFIMWVSSQSN